MHPGAGNYDKTIVNALMHYNKESLSTIGDELRPELSIELIKILQV